MASRFLMPWTIFAPLILLGVVLTDLVMDESDDPQVPVVYYTRQRSATGLIAAAVPAIVVVGFLPLVVRVFRDMTVWDVGTAAIGVPAAAIFAAVLVPLQEELMGGTITDGRRDTILYNVRVLHWVLFGAMLACIALQLAAHRVDIGSLVRPKES